MTKVLIINTPGMLNKGGMAAVMGAFSSLREAMPDAEITVLCHHVQEDWDTLDGICKRYHIQIKKHPWLKEHDSKLLKLAHSSFPGIMTLLECYWDRIASKLGIKPRGILSQHDVILGLDIDNFHDHYGAFIPLWTLSNLTLGIIAGKTVVVWGAGIGRFRKRFTRTAARLVLNRVDMIVARDEMSRDYLGEIGVTKPRIEATADQAFFMDPAPAERIDEIFDAEGIQKSSRPLVGIAASQLIHRYAFPEVKSNNQKYEHFVSVMTSTIDYLTSELDADVLLISHVLVKNEDDRIINADISHHASHKEKIKILAGNYLADELKGVIGRCDLFIGGRMHPMIASTSMAVPTIALIYGEKAYGILGDMMGQADYLVEVAKYSPEEMGKQIKQMIDISWDNREAIHTVLKDRSTIARQLASLNGTLVKEISE